MSRNRCSFPVAVVAVVAAAAVSSGAPPGGIAIDSPIEGQLSLVGDIVVRVDVGELGDPSDVSVELDGLDVSGLLAASDGVLEGTVPVGMTGLHELTASVPNPGGQARGQPRGRPFHARRSFETVALENPDECELLNATECLLPYPSSRFLDERAATATGVQVNLPAEGLPVANGPALDPAPYNELDGFSPMVQILMHFPGGVDVEASEAARLLAPECCRQPAGPPWIDTRTYTDRSLERDSPTVLIEAETGERVLHFVEPDARAQANPARQVLFLRPGISLKPGTRYIVAVRDLVDPAGESVEPEAAFAVLRDGRFTDIVALADRAPYYESHIFPQLEAAGVAREDLLLAFDFTTQSEDQLTRQMLSMRDQAFAWLTAREAELVPGDASTETFAVSSVQDFDCNDAVLARIVSGTFQSPLFLDGDLAGDSPQFMNVDENDLPVQNGVTNASYTIGIPCSLLEPGSEPARPLILGHGLFGTGAGMVEGIAELTAELGREFDYIAGATDFRGLASPDFNWVASQIIGFQLGAPPPLDNKLNNLPAFPDRLRQGMLNTLVLARMMKRAFFNNNPAFMNAFPGPGEEAYYYGISLGGVMGTFFSALTPDVERFGVDVPAINFSILLQRSTQFSVFELALATVGLTDPMQVALGIGLFHELWVGAEPAGYARHVTRDPLPGSGGPSKLLMTVAWLDKQVSNQGSEIAARTLELPNLSGSIQQGLHGIPDVDTGVAGPQDSALVIWDTGSFDILDPMQEPFIPPLANRIPTTTCDPHGFRPAIPASVDQLMAFLRPGGQIENTCDGLCDASSPAEKPANITPECDPFLP